MASPELSIWLVLGAGLIDGINPCAFAVLIFMIGYLLNVVKDKKKIILSGSLYILSVYATYLFVGLGLLSFIQHPLISETIYLIAGFLAIITGVINIKDFFHYGVGFTLRIPVSQKPRINEWVKKGSAPSAIALGFMVSLFELPCTGSVYFAILALLGQASAQAITYLFLYNLMFVLPLIIILIAILTGYSVKKVNEFKDDYKDYMKLLSGLLLLGLGAWMLFSVYG